MKVCPVCKAENENERLFCYKCGTKLARGTLSSSHKTSTAQQAINKPTKSNGSILDSFSGAIKVASVIFLIVGLIGSIILAVFVNDSTRSAGMACIVFFVSALAVILAFIVLGALGQHCENTAATAASTFDTAENAANTMDLVYSLTQSIDKLNKAVADLSSQVAAIKEAVAPAEESAETPSDK